MDDLRRAWKLLQATGILPLPVVIAAWSVTEFGLWIIPHVTTILYWSIAIVITLICAGLYRIWYEHEYPGYAHSARWQRQQENVSFRMGGRQRSGQIQPGIEAAGISEDPAAGAYEWLPL